MRSAVLVLLLLAIPAVAAAQAHVEVVLDASATMNRRFKEGGSRLTVAKTVIATLVDVLPEGEGTIALGLRVLGSSHAPTAAEACEDSRLLVPPDTLNRNALLYELRAIEARGRSPVAYALAEAARDFPDDAETRLLILITDGWDSCGGDLEGVMASLAEAEPAVQLVVIGLSLNTEISQRFAGLESFTNTTEIVEVVSAMARTIKPLAALATEARPVSVVVQSQSAQSEPLDVSLVSAISGKDHVVSADGETAHAEVPTGVYNARLQWGEEKSIEVAGLNVRNDLPSSFELHIPSYEGLALELDPEHLPAGMNLEVLFDGVPAGSAWLTVAARGAPAHEVQDRVWLQGSAGTVTMRAPVTGGVYEVRLHLEGADGTSTILTHADLVALPGEVWIDAPEALETMDGFELQWSGPEAEGDFIALVPVEAAADDFGEWTDARATNPLDLFAPVEPCIYEARYVSAQSLAVLARIMIEVTEPEAELRGPKLVRIDDAVEILWLGPDAANDYVTIVAEGAADGQYLDWAFTESGNPLRLTAPHLAGRYELRYMSGPDDRVLDRVPIEVEGIEISLDAPHKVATGSRFMVEWTGPNGNGDFVCIAAQGASARAHRDFFFTSLGSPSSLAAPFNPGSYEIRYVSGSDHETLLGRPITVE